MYISYIKLINYIGIYNGLGLNELEIDLSKRIHKMLLIKGKNGSGKSTLFNALNIFPDSNSNFIPDLEAHKYINIVDDNILYKMHFVHSVKSNGERDTTKAYIKKYTNGTIDDMNSNGNVTSFKEIVFNEFSLDPNYLALSSLGSENKGLSDKKPQDRKRFVNSIISSLVVYNDIYKTLMKRSSIFKAMINNLVAKISSVGDEEKLKASLISIENRLNSFMVEKDAIIDIISSAKSTIRLIDPNNSIQDTYNRIYTTISEYKAKHDKIMLSVSKYYTELNLDLDIDYSEVIGRYNEIKDTIDKLYTDIKVCGSSIDIMLKERENILSDIQSKKQKLSSLNSSSNIEELNSSMTICKETISEYDDMISTMGLIDLNISRDEYVLALNTLNDIKNTINIFKSNMELDTIVVAIDYVRNNNFPDIDSIDIEIENLNKYIKEQELLYQKYSTLKDISEKIKMRPNICKIDECLFIKDSLDALSQDPERHTFSINEILKASLVSLQDKLEKRLFYKNVVECINYLNTVLRSIDVNSKIFRKIKIGTEFSNRDIVLDMILSGYDFNIIDEVYKYIDYANIIDEYKSSIELLNTLNSELHIHSGKYDMMEDLENDISKMKSKADSITNDIASIKQNMDAYIKQTGELAALKDMYDKLVSNLNEKSTIESKKIELVSQFNAIKSSMTSIKQSLDGIQEGTSKLEYINKEVSPLIEDRDKIKYGLISLSDYKEELSIYNFKYEKIETIKKYSSPNKGIQTLFMELYMNKILSMSNELLSLVFDGEYVLCPFIINENEFRIPCIGSGLPNDDISSASCSQKSMMGLAINSALLCQSSTKYNILKVDELDAGLDTNNRLQFVYTLDRISDILKMEQVIVISHNSEIDPVNCDIIQLKKINGEIDSVGNIIYSYQ